MHPWLGRLCHDNTLVADLVEYRYQGFQFGDLDSTLAMEEVLREVPVVEDVRADKHAADCREREVKRPVPFPASGGGGGVNPIPYCGGVRTIG